MISLPEAADDLIVAAESSDRLAAWDAAGRMVAWLSDLRNAVNFDAIRNLVWTGAATNRWFDIAEVLAGAAAGRADATPGLQRLHAQMLMERGFLDEALARLEPLLKDAHLSDYDRGEAYGQIGRIHKDRFLSSVAVGDTDSARAHLKEAIDAYQFWYEKKPASVWHGINVVALMARPEANELRKDALEGAREIANSVRREVQSHPFNIYSDATMAEAYIALGDYEEALKCIRRYVSNPKVHAFMFGNFRRQLTGVWKLDQRPSPGPELIALINAALLEKEKGTLRLSGEEVQRARQIGRSAYEAVFGADRFDSYENYQRGLERCACVARIGRTVEVGVGTGFIIPGNTLSPKLGEEFILVTNSHVVSASEVERDQGALDPSEAVVTFAALDGVSPEKEFGLGEIRVSSPRSELDFTIVKLKEPIVSKSAYPISPVLPARNSNSLVRIVGHPSGRNLSLSVNRLLDHESPKLHYRTATEGGSSGSPVFNQDWKLIGLHHAGGEAVQKLNGQSGTYEANEGISMLAIRAEVEKRL